MAVSKIALPASYYDAGSEVIYNNFHGIGRLINSNTIHCWINLDRPIKTNNFYIQFSNNSQGLFYGVQNNIIQIDTSILSQNDNKIYGTVVDGNTIVFDAPINNNISDGFTLYLIEFKNVTIYFSE